jgi:chromosome partitioning protein
MLGKELILSEQLRMVADQYDTCIIDCAPPLSLLMVNALVASDDVIVPVQAHYYALEGLKQLLETVHVIRNRFHPCRVTTLGLLLTFFESRTALSREIQKQLRDYFGKLVFDIVIHRTVRLAEAPSAGECIFTYAPTCKAAGEYEALAQEVKMKIAETGVLR